MAQCAYFCEETKRLPKPRSLVQDGKVQLEAGEVHSFIERLSFCISPLKGFSEPHSYSQRTQRAGTQALRDTSPRTKTFRDVSVVYRNNCNSTNISHANAKMKVKKHKERSAGSVSLQGPQGRRKQTEN